VTRVAIRDSSHPGLNLTSASLNALLKYPWQRATTGKQSCKWGYYHSDKEDFDWARARDKNSDKRSAEADIMDWADDVAYSIHDVDDLYRAGLVPLDRILTGGGETERFLEAMTHQGVITKPELAADLFKQLRDFVVQKEIMMPFEGTSAQYQALRRFERFLTRRFLGLTDSQMLRLSADTAGPRLVIMPQLREEVNVLKGLMTFYVYESPALVAQQYGQRQIIKGLFKILRDAAKNKKPATSKIFPPLYDERLKTIKKTEETNPSEASTERIRLVMDVIASMTEQQAIAFHQRLSGAMSGLLSDRIFGA
jgi:dGTPase